MSATFDAASGVAGNGNPTTWTHTPVGVPSAIEVSVCWDAGGGETVSSVTYGGQACTLKGQSNYGSRRAAKYYKISPLAGAQNVVVTMSAACSRGFGCISLLGTSLVDLYLDFDTAGGSSAAASVVTTGGGLVADCVVCYNHPTCDASQTLRWNVDHAGGLDAAGSTEPTTGATTMSWTLASDDWAIAASSFAAAPSGAMWWFSSRKWKHFVDDLKRGLVPPDILQRRWGELLRPI